MAVDDFKILRLDPRSIDPISYFLVDAETSSYEFTIDNSHALRNCPWSCRHKSATMLVQIDPSWGLGLPRKEFCRAGIRRSIAVLVLLECTSGHKLLKIDAEVKELEIWIALVFVSYPHTSTTHPLFFLSRKPSSFLKRTPNPSRSLCNTITLLIDTTSQPPNQELDLASYYSNYATLYVI